ncbi:hypothetical protein B0H66DRAFT_559466 [Apodospora peruviana]|uniref:SsuA/THI5-like domain-containing protein n=1 Tax=Apodospora peruviana TaxID=516989 RepID=A0AAE0I780_9PEZI|nr:hypothetical protein B0H66DRAFT_559466 [Apodospora peruviana]
MILEPPTMYQTFSSALLPPLFTSLPGVTALTVAAMSQNIEATPLVVALEDHYNSTSYRFINGLPALGADPGIDLYAGSEVHVLHDAPQHPDLRVLATVVEFSYRIVADRRKGIHQPSDLRDKRIGVVAGVTYRVLCLLVPARRGRVQRRTSTRSSRPASSATRCPAAKGRTYPHMLATTGEIDALTAFEPTTTVGGMALGEENAIFFRNDLLYRKLNVLYTTQAKLDNVTARAEIVGFLRALGKTQEVFTKEPEKILPRVAEITAAATSNMTVNMATEEIMRKFWPLTKWARGLAADMVDLMVEEDKWLAVIESRSGGPMSRERIESLVDDRPLKEALALEG